MTIEGGWLVLSYTFLCTPFLLYFLFVTLITDVCHKTDKFILFFIFDEEVLAVPAALCLVDIGHRFALLCFLLQRLIKRCISCMSGIS